MAGSSSTTSPGMQAAAGHLDNTRAIADKGVQTVNQALAELKATWTGLASAKFDSSMSLWFEDCKYISGKLLEMTEILHGNRKIIEAGEQANTDVAGNIPVGQAGLAGL